MVDEYELFDEHEITDEIVSRREALANRLLESLYVLVRRERERSEFSRISDRHETKLACELEVTRLRYLRGQVIHHLQHHLWSPLSFFGYRRLRDGRWWAEVFMSNVSGSPFDEFTFWWPCEPQAAEPEDCDQYLSPYDLDERRGHVFDSLPLLKDAEQTIANYLQGREAVMLYWWPATTSPPDARHGVQPSDDQ